MPKVLPKPTIKPITTPQTRRQILIQLGLMNQLSTKTVQAVLLSLQTLMQGHLHPKGSGACVLPELGIKVKRRLKGAQPKRQRRNPATGETVMVKAQPAKPVLKLVATKTLKALVQG